MADNSPALDYLKALANSSANISQLNPVFAARMQNLIAAAQAATGDTVKIVSGYRSPEAQAQLRANYKQAPVTYGGKTYTPNSKNRYVASAPGHSEHNSGMAVDIVATGPAYKWMVAHAPDYGIKSLATLHGRSYDPPHFEMPPHEVGPALAGNVPMPPPLDLPGVAPIPLSLPAGLRSRAPVPPLPRERPADLPPPSLTSNALPPMPRPRPVTDIPAPMPNAPYTVNRTGPHQMQDTVVNGAIARGLDSIPDGAYQPIANGLSGLMGVVAPQQMPPLPRERPSLPDLPPPSLTTSTFPARPDVLAPNTFPSPFTNPGVQGLSPDARNPLPTVPGVIKTTGGIAGTVQMPRNVRPNIGPLPSSTLPLANEALIAGAPIDAPMPLPPPTLTGGLNPQGTIVGQDVTPVVPLPRLERQPVPVVPLSPPPEELAKLREAAENPLQRFFNATPLGHITSFVQNLGQAPHYGAPATGGLLAMLTGHGGVGGSTGGGLLGLLSGLHNSSPAQIRSQLTPQVAAQQNPLALAALNAGQGSYTAPGGLLMPTIAMNGAIRNSYGDYGPGSPYASNGSLSSLV